MIFFEKVKQIFEYSLHNKTIRQFRKMMTIEQFRSKDLFARLYTERYINRIVNYHSEIFRSLMSAGDKGRKPRHPGNDVCGTGHYPSSGFCDRQPEREAECLKMLKAHVCCFNG